MSAPDFMTGHFSFAKGGRDQDALNATLAKAAPHEAATLRLTSRTVDFLHGIIEQELKGLNNGQRLDALVAVGVNVSRSMVMSLLGTAFAHKAITRDMAVKGMRLHDARSMLATLETRASTEAFFIEALLTIEAEGSSR